MGKTIEIFGRDFEVVNSKKYPVTVEAVNRYMDTYSAKDLYSFYNRPSDVKQRIWEDWRNWARDSRYTESDNDTVQYMQVSSANCMMFTIDALVFDNKEYIKYMLHITPSHNYAYPVVLN